MIYNTIAHRPNMLYFLKALGMTTTNTILLGVWNSNSEIVWVHDLFQNTKSGLLTEQCISWLILSKNMFHVTNYYILWLWCTEERFLWSENWYQRFMTENAIKILINIEEKVWTFWRLWSTSSIFAVYSRGWLAPCWSDVDFNLTFCQCWWRCMTGSVLAATRV